MKKTAFTLIELIVSTSIIIIISVVSVSGFFDFLDNRTANIKISEFSEIVNDLDKKVRRKDTMDYEITLDTSMSGSIFVYENILYSDYYISFNNWVLTLLGGLDYNQIWSVFKFNESIVEDSFITNSELSLTLDDSVDYEIESRVYRIDIVENDTWERELKILEHYTNNIKLLRLDKENKEFALLWFSITEDWNKTWKMTIKNIWWKKEFIWEWMSKDTEKVFVYFRYREKDYFLKLDKY